MRYTFTALLLLVPLVSCGQTGPGSCPNQTIVGNNGGGLTCLTGSQASGIISASSGGVSSVANTDSTLVVSPTTGAVIASLNTSKANVWAGTQTFPNASITAAELAASAAATNVGSLGGSLTGTLPNPTIATSAVTNAMLVNMPGHTAKCNNTTSSAVPTDCSEVNLGGNFVASSNYTASNGQASGVQAIVGSIASPNSLADALAIFQKTSSNTGTGATINSTLYAAIAKTVTCNNCRATAIFTEAQDTVGGSGSFVEGGRFQGTLGAGSNGQSNGVVCSSGTGSSVVYKYIIGCEADLENNSGTNATTTFSTAKFVAGFVSSCSFGTNKCDVGFMTNPFDSPVDFIYGFMVPNGGVDSTGTAFYSNASATTGLDLSAGTFSFAAVAIPNNTPIVALNAAGASNLNIMYLNASNQLIMGAGTASPGVNCPAGVTAATVVVVGGIVTHC